MVLESVNAGESAIGIIYHYYWYRDQAEAGDNSDNTELYFFGNQDPGAFLSISGAGVLAAGDNPDEAQQFVEYLTSEEGQQALADSYALEYPLNPAVSLEPPVKPLSRARAADRRHQRPRRRQGRRDDDPGRLPLTGRPRGPGAVLVLLGVLVAATSLLPLGYVLVSAAQLGPGEAVDFLVRPRVGELLWNTTRLLVGGVLLSVVLGVGVRGWWCGPTCRSATCGTACWPHRSPYPPSSTATPGSRPRTPSRGTPAPCWWSACPTTRWSTCRPSPRCVASTPASRTSPPRSATGRRRRSSRVVLPAISPAVLGGALLVGLHLLGEYGALQLLNYPTLTTGILALYRTTFNGPAATLLALVLVAFCLLLLGLELLVRGRRRRARVGAGVSRTATRARLGRSPRGRRRRAGRADRAHARRPARQPGPLAGPRHLDDVPGRRHLGRDR